MNLDQSQKTNVGSCRRIENSLALMATLLAVCVVSLVSADPPLDSSANRSNRVSLGSSDLTAGIPGQGELTLAQINSWLANSRNHEALKVTLPMGLDGAAANLSGLDENPMTRARSSWAGSYTSKPGFLRTTRLAAQAVIIPTRATPPIHSSALVLIPKQATGTRRSATTGS